MVGTCGHKITILRGRLFYAIYLSRVSLKWCHLGEALIVDCNSASQITDCNFRKRNLKRKPEFKMWQVCTLSSNWQSRVTSWEDNFLHFVTDNGTLNLILRETCHYCHIYEAMCFKFNLNLETVDSIIILISHRRLFRKNC